MLRGASELTLDAKNRLVIPTRYRNELLASCEGRFVCTVDVSQSCLLLYPLSAWEQIESRLSRLSNLNPLERKLQRLLLGYATDCEMDSQGRLLIAASLRQHIQLERKLMLVGQLNKFEIWDHQVWCSQVEQDIADIQQSSEELYDALQDFSL